MILYKNVWSYIRRINGTENKISFIGVFMFLAKIFNAVIAIPMDIGPPRSLSIPVGPIQLSKYLKNILNNSCNVVAFDNYYGLTGIYPGNGRSKHCPLCPVKVVRYKIIIKKKKNDWFFSAIIHSVYDRGPSDVRFGNFGVCPTAGRSARKFLRQKHYVCHTRVLDFKNKIFY